MTRQLLLLGLSFTLLVGLACQDGGSDLPSHLPAPSHFVEEYASYAEQSAQQARTSLERSIAIDELVDSCMGREGFEYQSPGRTDATSIAADLYTEASQLDYYSLAYRERFGYGISTIWVYSFQTEVYGVSEDVRAAGPETDLESAYWDALLGTEDDGGMGCLAQAHESVPVQQPVTEGLDPMDQRVQELRERLMATPEAVRAETDWGSCAASAGYQFRSRVDVENALYEQLDTYWIDSESSESVVEGPVDEGTEPVDAEQAPPPPAPDYPYDLAAIGDLQSQEIETAIALYPCDVEYYSAIEGVASDLAAALGL